MLSIYKNNSIIVTYISNSEFHLFYLIFLIFAIFERVHSTFRKKIVKKTKQIYYKWLFYYLFIAYLIIVVSSIVEYFTSRNSICEFVAIFGFLFYLIGVYFRRSAIICLGANWSLHTEIKENHELIVSGLYKRLKHPYYIAVILELTGLCLITNSYKTLNYVMIFILPALILRSVLEDNVLNSMNNKKISNNL